MFFFVFGTAIWVLLACERLRAEAYYYPNRPLANYLWATTKEIARSAFGLSLVLVALGLVSKFDFALWIGKLLEFVN